MLLRQPLHSLTFLPACSLLISKARVKRIMVRFPASVRMQQPSSTAVNNCSPFHIVLQDSAYCEYSDLYLKVC